MPLAYGASPGVVGLCSQGWGRGTSGWGPCQTPCGASGGLPLTFHRGGEQRACGHLGHRCGLLAAVCHRWDKDKDTGTLGGGLSPPPTAPQPHGVPMAKSLEGPGRGSRGCAMGKGTLESPKT